MHTCVECKGQGAWTGWNVLSCKVHTDIIDSWIQQSRSRHSLFACTLLSVRDNQNTQRINGFCFVCCLFFSSEMLFMCTLLSMRSYQNTQRVNCCCWMLFFSSEHLSCNGNCFFCGWCIDVYQTIGGGGGDGRWRERPRGRGEWGVMRLWRCYVHLCGCRGVEGIEWGM